MWSRGFWLARDLVASPRRMRPGPEKHKRASIPQGLRTTSRESCDPFVQQATGVAWRQLAALFELGHPHPEEDPESRAPNMVPYTTTWYFLGTLKGDLLSRSAQGSGQV